MKTPREILLERHQAATSKLDFIRRAVAAAEVNNRATKEQSSPNFLVSWFLCCSRSFWQELILPSRRIWAGLAAVWIFLLAVNFSQRDRSPAVAMKSAPGPAMILSFREQERLMSELLGPDEMRVAAPVKLFSPQPSSQRRFEILKA